MTPTQVTAVILRAREAAARRLIAAALVVQSQARTDLSKGNPSPHDHPAARGDFPRLRTGGGRASVAIEPAAPRAVMASGRVSVGYRPSGVHLNHLKRKGWLGLIDSFVKVRSRVTAILRGGSP